MGNGPQVANVLNGTYEAPPGTSEVTKAWLERMKVNNPDKLQKVTTSLRDFQ